MERPSCLIVTHSRWRGDFSSLALAQSCAAATCVANSKNISVRYFMAALPPSRKTRNLAQSAQEMRGAEKRVCMSLISNGEFAGIPHTGVFEKEAATIENKGRELAREGKEAVTH